MNHDSFRSQFRLPGKLYDLLKESAARNGRSLNAEIVARLEASFEPSVQETLKALIEAQTEILTAEIRRERDDQ